jgi:hypothetical protein
MAEQRDYHRPRQRMVAQKLHIVGMPRSTLDNAGSGCKRIAWGAKPMRLCLGWTNINLVILLACVLAPLKDTLAANPDIIAEIAGR